MLTFIVMIGVLTAGIVFGVWLMLQISHLSVAKQAEWKIKQRTKDEVQF